MKARGGIDTNQHMIDRSRVVDRSSDRLPYRKVDNTAPNAGDSVWWCFFE